MTVLGSTLGTRTANDGQPEIWTPVPSPPVMPGSPTWISYDATGSTPGLGFVIRVMLNLITKSLQTVPP